MRPARGEFSRRPAGGDVADADITTPAALDVVDAAATAALQTSRALQIPAVFRNIPAATNVLAHEFSRGRRKILLLRGEKAGLREDVAQITAR